MSKQYALLVAEWFVRLPHLHGRRGRNGNLVAINAGEDLDELLLNPFRDPLVKTQLPPVPRLL